MGAALRWLLKALALAAVYTVVARLGLRYATIGPSISPIAGAFLANAATDVPLLAAAGIACGNTAEATLAAYLLRSRAGRYLALDDLRGVRALVFFVAPLGALASAFVGVTTLFLTGVLSGRPWESALGLWWGGDFLGAVVVAPVFLAWVAPLAQPATRRRIVEMLLLGVGCVLAAELVLGGIFPPAFLARGDYPYLLFPFVIAAALRFGPRGASLTVLVIALLAVAHAARGGGPFVMQTVPNTAVALLLYVGILAIVGLTLGAVAAGNERAERGQRDANESFRAVIQSAPLAIYTLDTSSNVRTWNSAAEALYGWRAEEVVGRPLPTIADDAEHHRLRERVLRGDALKGLEVTRRKKDGTPVTLSLSVAPLHDADGQVTGMLTIAADLTELRQLEVQYRQAQKMEAVGRLAGGVAHDFNNLLTAILGTTSLLLEDLGPDAPARLDVQEIEKAGKRAAVLTRQLLAFSRQQILDPHVVDVNALVVNLERMLHRLIGEHIELKTSLAPGLGAVRADPGQLEQAIVNLVVNARDAMPQGGLLTIETANTDLDSSYAETHVPAQPGAYVRLAITDTGTGMDAATRAHLFEPFFTTKPPGKGTGLGLATVYGIVKQSGGYIWAYSELGHGTTFKIYLPRVAAAAEPREPSSGVAQSSRGSETVLVVEDQAEVRTLARRALERRGYAVLEAWNGQEALGIAERHPSPIHLLVTDVVMPGMNGRELGAHLTRQRPDMKVLYVSGYPDESVVRDGLVEPGLAFLQKPFTQDTLARKVREVLDTLPPAGRDASTIAK